MLVDTDAERGLSLAPFRAVRYTVGAAGLGDRLCPPYDVISAAERAALVAGDPANAVRLILPGPEEAALAGGDAYAGAAVLLDRWSADGVLAVDEVEALYVYEMAYEAAGAGAGVTRGLLGAVELRDPAEGVILPHENTMAGPVADRLALMSQTQANLEPIYLVYDGGGAASRLVAEISAREPLALAHTPDGVTHRLWAETDPATLDKVAADLSTRRALIADGHHRYATYRQLQAEHAGAPGPWDRGLTLLVDSSSYGPQVHPIHRVIALGFPEALTAVREVAKVSDTVPLAEAERRLDEIEGFALALSDGQETVIVTELDPALVQEALGSAAGSTLGQLDVSVLHQVLVPRVWSLPDEVGTVDYEHSVADAVAAARARGGTAVLLRATPVSAVAAVAAAGQRMPRKSTLFTPKPASGLVIRRFADAAPAAEPGYSSAAARSAASVSSS
ncbi:MAG: hypothetical protein JWO63_798 [Frankiales bacterium]|nr:hypothetical protein [Frankiales bacterium]